MCLADRFTIVPPKPSDIDKLCLLFKECGNPISVAGLPCFNKDQWDILGPIQWAVGHIHSLVSDRGPMQKSA